MHVSAKNIDCGMNFPLNGNLNGCISLKTVYERHDKETVSYSCSFQLLHLPVQFQYRYLGHMSAKRQMPSIAHQDSSAIGANI